MEHRAKITIGLPVYNGEKFLSESLDSLVGQSFHEIDLLISDNTSSDTTEAICRSHAERDRRIRYVRQPENLGAVGNFDYVFQHRAAPYFMWAAHDDLWEKDFIKDGIEAIERENSCFAFPTFRLVNIKDKKWDYREAKLFEFISHESADHRVLNYLNLHPFSHNANIIYSIFKEDSLDALLKKQDISSGILFGSLLLKIGKGSIIPRYQFLKRHDGKWPGASNWMNYFRKRIKKRGHEEFYKAKAADYAVLMAEVPHLEDEIKSIYNAIHPNRTAPGNYRYVDLNRR